MINFAGRSEPKVRLRDSFLIILVVTIVTIMMMRLYARLNVSEAEGATYHRLIVLGEIAREFEEAGVDWPALDSAQKYLTVAARRGFVSDADYSLKRYERDGWNRPFRFVTKNVGGHASIVVASAGSNGIWENGAGDDISIEIVREKEAVVYRLNPTPR
jgi:hypothetical protein